MANRKTVHKWWWAWDFEREEQWLNSMAMDGWVLDSAGFCTYHFIRCEPGEYTIRLQMVTNDAGYMDFMREIDAEVCGRYFKWVFFRRKSELGEFRLFSDIDSRIGHFNSIGNMISIFGAMNIILGVVNSINRASIGWINLLCGCLLMYGLGRIHGTVSQLKKERDLHE